MNLYALFIRGKEHIIRHFRKVSPIRLSAAADFDKSDVCFNAKI